MSAPLYFTEDDALLLCAALVDDDFERAADVLDRTDPPVLFVLDFLGALCGKLLPLVTGGEPLADGGFWALSVTGDPTGADARAAIDAHRLVTVAANGEGDTLGALARTLVLADDAEHLSRVVGSLLTSLTHMLRTLKTPGGSL